MGSPISSQLGPNFLLRKRHNVGLKYYVVANAVPKCDYSVGQKYRPNLWPVQLQIRFSTKGFVTTDFGRKVGHKHNLWSISTICDRFFQSQINDFQLILPSRPSVFSVILDFF